MKKSTIKNLISGFFWLLVLVIGYKLIYTRWDFVYTCVFYNAYCWAL